jgi:hypothetical protein
MSAVTSVNPGAADVLQFLSNSGSQSVSSAFSSPSVQSAVKSASPTDLVSLSAQALQLQEATGLFGSSGSSETSPSPESLLLQALIATSGSQTSGSSTAAVATATSALEQGSSLFGASTGSLSCLG